METFLTQDILDDITDTSSHKNAEARGQGIGNIASSLFGGMAGCALVGVMVMIAINTANWGSISGIRRIPKSDTSVMLLTVGITVLTHNLAVGLLAGVAMAGILFSRKVATASTGCGPAVLHEQHLLPPGLRAARTPSTGDDRHG